MAHRRCFFGSATLTLGEVTDVFVGVLLAVLGVAVPVLAAAYEFLVKGRKRLGYRVQMDTTATDVVHTEYAGALDQLQKDGRALVDPTIVLLRIENNGLTYVDADDYVARQGNGVGIRVRFPGRRVTGMVITELSHRFLATPFETGSALAVHEDVIDLPKVPLNRRAHYKVLAALEKGPDHVGDPGDYRDPEVIGGIKGGVRGGTIGRTRSNTGLNRYTVALIAFLVLLVIGQLVLYLRNTGGVPMDCAGGNLALTGSTAAEPVLREAAGTYARTCGDAAFTFDLDGSQDGLYALQESRSTETLAFSDGEKPGNLPGLVPRPLALFLFTVVTSKESGVNDLTVAEIRGIYTGRYRNWSELGGNQLAIKVVSRNPLSGTRTAFQKRMLGGVREEGTNSDDCRTRDPKAPEGVLRCERRSTKDVLKVVSTTPGAIGYSELGAASTTKNVALVRIGGHAATTESADQGAYPFWETEYGYTYGDPGATSLAASFLRYLTNQVGADILRTHGNRPCGELQNPALCRPAPLPAG